MRKAKLGYILGNMLHSVGVLLFLPSAYKLNAELGILVSIGFVSGQIAAVAGNYSFAVIGPRAIIAELNRKEVLFSYIFSYKILTLISSLLLALIYCIFTVKNPTVFLLSMMISYSMVLYVQWYHMMCSKNIIPQLFLIISRISLIFLCVSILIYEAIGAELKLETFLYFYLLLVYFPNICSLSVYYAGLNRRKVYRENANQSFKELVKVGRPAFVASLTTMTYQIGPSLLTGVLDVNSLLYVQQFDRIRMIIGNFSGVIFSAIYPAIISSGKKDILSIQFLKMATTAYILSSALILLLIELISQTKFLQGIQDTLLLTNISFGFSLICGLTATFSGLLANTYYFPKNLDRQYFLAIVVGSVIFLLFSTVSIYWPAIFTTNTILAVSSFVFLAELSILLLLVYWVSTNRKVAK